jgi:diacylglycerol kinase (ATP)
VRWLGGGGGHATSINVVGTGLMAVAAERCNQRWKWLGRRGYDVAAAIELLGLSPRPTRLVIDGKDVSGEHPLIACCNSQTTGGGMRIAPDARPDDGLLDVMTAEGASRWQLLGLLATKVHKGLHVHHPRVRVRKATCIEIGAAGPSPLLVDGEVLGQAPVRLEVLPGALNVLA